MEHINHLVINLLSSLTTDQADVTDDENFYDVLASYVQIFIIETSLNGHILASSRKKIAVRTVVLMVPKLCLLKVSWYRKM